MKLKIPLFWQVFAIFASVSSVLGLAGAVMVSSHWVERDWQTRFEARVEREAARALAGEPRTRLRYLELRRADGQLLLQRGHPPRRHQLHEFTLTDANGAELTARTSYPPPPRLLRQALARLKVAQLLALLAGALLASALVSRLIARPLAQLAAASRAFARDPDAAAVPPQLAARGDEIGELAAGFAAAMARTRASLAAQRALTRDTSHELRAPLARLQTLVGLLEQAGGPPELLDQVHAECDQLRGLIGEITTLARADSAADLMHAPVDLAALVSEQVDLWRARAPERAIALQACGAARLARGDTTLLSRGFGNLLANACRYSTPGSPILVTIEQNNDIEKNNKGYELCVADTGPGLSVEELTRVAQPFYRGQGAMHGEGFGLGLTIAARAAEAHGGELKLTINEQGGLSAALNLPVTNAK